MARHIPPPPKQGRPQAQAMARDAFGREIPAGPVYGGPQQQQPAFGSPGEQQPKEKAVDALGRRAGELSDEIDFPAFVASLVHGTFDAIVDSSIRQTESFAELVSAVSKPLDQFIKENTTDGQARGWLVENYPDDVTLADDGSGQFKLVPLAPTDEFDTPELKVMGEFDLEGQAGDSETLETEVLPRARERMARQRLSTLASMVLMGMQRVVVKDGVIDTSLRFRAAARDRAAVDYATGNDTETPQSQWGMRGSQRAAVKVATVDVNAQSDTQLAAEVRGKVRINFASDYVPLERFIDDAQRTLLERHSRQAEIQRAVNRAVAEQQPQPGALPAPAVSAPAQPVAPPTQPSTQAPPQPAVAPAPTPQAPAPGGTP